MKKRILYITFFLMTGMLWSQHRYKVTYDFTAYPIDNGDHTVRVELLNPSTGASPVTILSYFIDGCLDGDNVVLVDDFVFESPILYTHVNRNLFLLGDPCLGGLSGSIDDLELGCLTEEDAAGLVNNTIPTSVSGGTLPPVEFLIIRLEENNLDATTNNFTECETKTLSIASNVSCVDQGINYGVEYQIGNSSVWQSFLAYQTRPLSFSFQGTDFPGLSTGDNLRIRIQLDNPTAADPTYSDILTYNYIDCSPQVDTIDSTPTTCSQGYNSDDGGFTINFDRALNAGERLDFINLDYAGPDNTFGVDASDPAFLDDVSGFQTVNGFNDPNPSVLNYTGTSVTWPFDVPVGAYRVEYQSAGAASLEISDPFIIDRPDPITFQAEGSDISCYEEDDGSIRIFNVMGGVGNYQFSLNNGTTWARFDNATATSHTVLNLGPDNYQVKLRDGNGCIAQE